MAVESALKYRSKIDLLRPLLALACFLQGFVLLCVYDSSPPLLRTYGGWLLVGIGILSVFSMLTTTYKITDRELIVRVFMLPMRIPLKGIERVAQRESLAIGRGSSADAVEVKYRTNRTTGSVVISPRDKEAFIRELTLAVQRLLAPTTEGSSSERTNGQKNE